MKKIEKQNFIQTTELDDLILRTEQMYIKDCENGDRHKGMAALRIPTKKRNIDFIVWRVGLYIGLTLPVLSLLFVKCSDSAFRATVPDVDTILQASKIIACVIHKLTSILILISTDICIVFCSVDFPPFIWHQSFGLGSNAN